MDGSIQFDNLYIKWKYRKIWSTFYTCSALYLGSACVPGWTLQIMQTIFFIEFTYSRCKYIYKTELYRLKFIFVYFRNISYIADKIVQLLFPHDIHMRNLPLILWSHSTYQNVI